MPRDLAAHQHRQVHVEPVIYPGLAAPGAPPWRRQLRHEAAKTPFLRATRTRHFGACPAVAEHARNHGPPRFREIVPGRTRHAIPQEPKGCSPNEMALPPCL